MLQKFTYSKNFLCVTLYSSKRKEVYPMQINSIDKNSFEGNFIKSRSIKNGTEQFVDQIINYSFNGVTNKQLLEDKTFDVFITNTGRKNIEGKPFLNFQSRFDSLNTDIQTVNHKFSTDSRIDDGVEANADKLRRHILSAANKKREENGFNTFGEKVKSYFKMALGIY